MTNAPSPAFEALKSREEHVLCRTYGRYPLAVARAKGSRLYDLDGREYVDLLSGIAVTALGHSHPEVIQAMCRQAEELVHVSNVFYQEPQVALAEALLATWRTDATGKVFFCNSGAEANEAACKLARRYMQRVQRREAYEILTLEGSFHGRTLAMVAATGQERFKDGFAPLPEGFRSVPFADLEALRAALSPRTAGVLVEIIQGEGGIRPLPVDYLQALQALCREHGVLFMVDEIQTGLCRTGRYWAHQHHGLEPDVITSAKALANGLPLAAMLCTDEAARGFEPGMHATTFGGGGVVTAAGRRVLEIMGRDDLCGRAASLGQRAKELFGALQARRPADIAEIRGLGLMLGVVLSFPGQEVWKALLEAGFVCNLTQERVLRLLPALTIDFADLEAFAAALETILAHRS